jgi:hypothetical protein
MGSPISSIKCGIIPANRKLVLTAGAEGFTMLFVLGDSLQAVNPHAIQMMANSNSFWEAFQIVSALKCGNSGS